MIFLCLIPGIGGLSFLSFYLCQFLEFYQFFFAEQDFLGFFNFLYCFLIYIFECKQLVLSVSLPTLL